MTMTGPLDAFALSPAAAWSQRVRKVGGYIQLAFAAFWLLLSWLDHLVHIPRLRPVGWALTVGPFILVAVLSGSALAATTGLAAGVILLGTATAGFHDLASLRPHRPSSTVGHNTRYTNA